MPENWVSKLNFRTELGLYVGSSHPKTMSEMTKPPLERDIVVDPGKKLYFAVKEKVWGGIVQITFLNIRN